MCYIECGQMQNTPYPDVVRITISDALKIIKLMFKEEPNIFMKGLIFSIFLKTKPTAKN